MTYLDTGFSTAILFGVFGGLPWLGVAAYVLWRERRDKRRRRQGAAMGAPEPGGRGGGEAQDD